MTSATTYSSGGIILEEDEFTYDVFDRRIAKTVDADGAGPNAAETTYTVYDGEHAWADFDESGAFTARYLFGNRIDEILARWRPGEGTAWHLTDHLGTVRDIVNVAGVLINTITYDSFGNIVNQTNAAAGDRFTYTGREYDGELALYYYRARFYDPRLGRFVSQDPLGFVAGDANLYRYVGNNGLHTIDPDGKLAIAEKTALIGAAVGAGFGLGCNLAELAVTGEWNEWRAFTRVLEGAFLGAVYGFGIGGGIALSLLSQALTVRAIGGTALAFFFIERLIDQYDFLAESYDAYENRRPHSGKVFAVRAACAALEVTTIAIGFLRTGTRTLSIRSRLGELYSRLRRQAPSATAEHALERVSKTLNEVEDDFSGVPRKDPPPAPDMPDGRMYPPMDDYTIRNPDGSISAETRGHDIQIASDGSIQITNKRTGRVEFRQAGGGS